MGKQVGRIRTVIAALALALGSISLGGTSLGLDSAGAITPTLPTGGNIYSISCTSPTWCVGVGVSFVQGSSTESPLAEIRNGSEWTVSTLAVPADLTWGIMYGVSCTSRSFCQAVGLYYSSTKGADLALAEEWNGTSWAVSATPAIAATVVQLNSVSCLSSRRCEAVGYSSNDGGLLDYTLAEKWTGTAWTVQKSPTPLHGATPMSVSCLSPSWCMAAGSRLGKVPGDTYSELPFAESWDGSKWAALHAFVPDPRSVTRAELQGVSCTSSSSCEAVGSVNTSSTQQSLAEVWNGTTWTRQPMPSSAKAPDASFAVSCVSTSWCAAIGAGTHPWAADFWNGSTWTVGPSLVPPDGDASFEGVTCLSSTNCQAVGDYTTTNPDAPPPADSSWNGSKWTVHPLPVP